MRAGQKSLRPSLPLLVTLHKQAPTPSRGRSLKQGQGIKRHPGSIQYQRCGNMITQLTYLIVILNAALLAVGSYLLLFLSLLQLSQPDPSDLIGECCGDQETCEWILQLVQCGGRPEQRNHSTLLDEFCSKMCTQ